MNAPFVSITDAEDNGNDEENDTIGELLPLSLVQSSLMQSSRNAVLAPNDDSGTAEGVEDAVVRDILSQHTPFIENYRGSRENSSSERQQLKNSGHWRRRGNSLCRA